MAKIRLTKAFNFEMAHALLGYDGPCRNIHGHSYELFVTIIGEPANDPQNPKTGMIVDFGQLKRLIRDTVIDNLDHALMLNADSPPEHIRELEKMFDRIISVPYQPTCENMLEDFAQRIMEKLPEGVKLHSLKLRETVTSYAEWYAEDNT